MEEWGKWQISCSPHCSTRFTSNTNTRARHRPGSRRSRGVGPPRGEDGGLGDKHGAAALIRHAPPPLSRHECPDVLTVGLQVNSWHALQQRAARLRTNRVSSAGRMLEERRGGSGRTAAPYPLCVLTRRSGNGGGVRACVRCVRSLGMKTSAESVTLPRLTFSPRSP